MNIAVDSSAKPQTERAPSIWLSMFDERVLLGLVLAFALSLRLVMALTVPPWQGPDEPKHFEYVRILVEKRAQFWAERRLPAASDSSAKLQNQIIGSMARHHYWEYLGGKTPDPLPTSFYAMWKATGTAMHMKSALTPLYYVLSAIFLFPFQGASLENQLLVVRLLSVVLSTATVAVTYFAARELMPKDRFIPIASAAFVAALPMHAFIGGVVNTDNLVTLLGSVVAYGLAICFRRGFTFRRWALVFAALALVLITKRTAAGLLPAVLLAGLFSLVSLRGRLLRLTAVILMVLCAAATVASLTGVVGHLLENTEIRKLAIAYSLNELGERQLQALFAVPFRSPMVHQLILFDLDSLFRSFWGIFGWFSLPLGEGLYRILYAITGVCFVGILLYLVLQLILRLRYSSKVVSGQFPLLLIYLSSILSMAILAVAERLPYLSLNEIPQGRYLFVVVAPIAAVYALGARTILPARFFSATLASLFVLLMLAILDLVVYFQYILPYFGFGSIV